MSFGGHSMVAPLRRVAVKRPEDAWTEATPPGFIARPDLDRASEEHVALVELLQRAGVEVAFLPRADGTDLDSIYAHDAALVTDEGLVPLNTGKPNRRTEGLAYEIAAREWCIPLLGSVDPPGTAEAGDVVWVGPRLLAVGRGFRTNAAGVVRLRDLLAPLGVEVVEVHLPYDTGPADCLHLMSVVSMLDDDLAIVHRPMLPVPMFELLTEQGVELVDVDPDEYHTLGCNVLALGPRDVVVARGNPRTAGALLDSGCTVHALDVAEIGMKGCGGPTCLTRPLWREV